MKPYVQKGKARGFRLNNLEHPLETIRVTVFRNWELKIAPDTTDMVWDVDEKHWREGSP